MEELRRLRLCACVVPFPPPPTRQALQADIAPVGTGGLVELDLLERSDAELWGGAAADALQGETMAGLRQRRKDCFRRRREYQQVILQFNMRVHRMDRVLMQRLEPLKRHEDLQVAVDAACVSHEIARRSQLRWQLIETLVNRIVTPYPLE